jgi:hypothetical protein
MISPNRQRTSAWTESLAHNHAFIEGNKRFCFVMADILLRLNGKGGKLIIKAHTSDCRSDGEKRIRFPVIRDWIASVVKSLVGDE